MRDALHFAPSHRAVPAGSKDSTFVYFVCSVRIETNQPAGRLTPRRFRAKRGEMRSFKKFP